MEAYSSSKFSYSAQNPDGAKSLKNADSFRSQSHAMLHSVRKSQAKTWKKAPPPPTPVKLYKVDPLNFRDLVQQLTGAPEFKPQLLQRVAAPTATSAPNSILSAASSTVSTKWNQGAQSETLGGDHRRLVVEQWHGSVCWN